MIHEEVRIPVTRLKPYLDEVGITTQLLANLSGISRLHLSKCLNATVDERNGRVRTLGADALAELQESLHQLSLSLKYTFILYNKEKEITKRSGNRYCPDCVEQLKKFLSPYLRVSTFIAYALGWNNSKIRNTFDIRHSPSFGNISQDDVAIINSKLRDLATFLDAIVLEK